jgi:hypothetical protein
VKHHGNYLKIKLLSFFNSNEKSLATLTVEPIFKKAESLRLYGKRRLLDDLKNLIAQILAKTQDKIRLLDCVLVLS